MAAGDEHISIQVTSAPSPEDVRALERGLFEQGRDRAPGPGSERLAVLARDGRGRLVGGAVARVHGSWLHVWLLWVAEDLRGGGIGAFLLAAVEDEGRARGCTRARIDAFGDRARSFCERHGWRVFAALEDEPGDHQPLFLRKEL